MSYWQSGREWIRDTIIGDQGRRSSFKERWRADGVILGCDKGGSQIKDGLSLRCAKGEQHDLECDERKEILNPSR